MINGSERFTKQGKRLEKNQDYHILHVEGGAWGILDSTFDHYLLDLAQLEYYSGELRQIITNKKNPVIIDLLASTGMLNDLHRLYLHGTEAKTIAVGHYDNRSSYQKTLDPSHNISFVEGNLKDPSTWQELRDELNGDSADLVISRGLAGLHFLPTRLQFAHRVIPEVYDLLNTNGGSAFLQIPPLDALTARDIPVEDWFSQLRAIEGFSFRYIPEYESVADNRRTYGLLRIDRMLGIPSLPTADIGRPLIHQAA